MYEKQLWEQVAEFSKLTSDASSLQSDIRTAVVAPELEEKISELLSRCQEKLSHVNNIHIDKSDDQERLIHLLGVQDDLCRQHQQARNAIHDQSSKESFSMAARKEPLDAVSQSSRRRILSKCCNVQRLLESSEQCLSLNKYLFGSQHRAPLRPSEYFNQLTNSSPIIRHPSQSANNAIFKSLKGQYDRTLNIDTLSKTLQQSVTRLSESHPHRLNRHQTTESQVKRASAVISGRKSISPLPTKHITSLFSSQKTKPMTPSSMEYNSLLRRIADDLSHSAQDRGVKIFHLANRKPYSSTGVSDWKSKGKNELLPSTRKKEHIMERKQNSSPVVKTLFSSPIAGTQSRPQWSTQSNVAPSGKLVVNIPTSLKEIHASDAAKTALGR